MRLRPLLLVSLAGLLLARCASPGNPTGSPCAGSSDCRGGSEAVCLTSAGVYVNGYCSQFCDQDPDCGPGAFCETSTGNGLCVEACKSEADCRAADGYQCYPPDADAGADAGRTACLPVYPPPDGGAPDAGSGDAG
ncbi:MAG: hypothetical protein ACYDCL_08105 [Myxococcales bacterium]